MGVFPEASLLPFPTGCSGPLQIRWKRCSLYWATVSHWVTTEGFMIAVGLCNSKWMLLDTSFLSPPFPGPLWRYRSDLNAELEIRSFWLLVQALTPTQSGALGEPLSPLWKGKENVVRKEWD